MANVRMILVGGFLGAGKTTLLARSAELLAARGLRVGLVTNDQAANLVDTSILEQTGRPVQEVSGACFCCAFNKLIHVCDQLIATAHPDVIIGEPVGSCTDLSATVLQPIKKYCTDRFALAPYSVLVDADRLAVSLQPASDPDEVNVRYIYRKQIEEADLIVLNKVDALSADQLAQTRHLLSQTFPGLETIELSARTGAGVAAWLERMLIDGPAGTHVVPVDYDAYAAGEAALGWLNAAVKLDAKQAIDWHGFVTDLLAELHRHLSSPNAAIAHLKLILAAGGPAGGTIQANVVSSSAAADVRGQGQAVAPNAVMVVNARVRTTPDHLRAVVEQSLAEAAGKHAITFQVTELDSLQPGRPTPVHRFSAAVDGGA